MMLVPICRRYDVFAPWVQSASLTCRLHPLRGNLFGNLVIFEALKYRYNRGMEPHASIRRPEFMTCWSPWRSRG
ncbi:MAG TPA: hypothetical protein DDY22_11060 [Geobacter sp.]|nr:hypothetical protein [Geobacter sp.]